MPTNEKTTQKYDFKKIESKWQQRWEQQKLYKSIDIPDKKNKFYMLVMFAYPSGDIHMGHFRNYIIGDAVARQQMMLGCSASVWLGCFRITCRKSRYSKKYTSPGLDPGKYRDLPLYTPESGYII